MSGQSILSVESGFLGILGFVPYIFSILKGKTKPAKASWLIWAFLNTTTLIAMLVKKAANPQIASIAVGSLIVAALALKYGVPGWTALDKFCLAGACFGVAIWLYFSNPTLGLVVSLFVGPVIGAIPTMISAYKYPERENKWAWTIFWCSSLCAILATTVWDIDHAAQPIAFISNQTVTMLLLWVSWRPTRVHV